MRLCGKVLDFRINICKCLKMSTFKEESSANIADFVETQK